MTLGSFVALLCCVTMLLRDRGGAVEACVQKEEQRQLGETKREKLKARLTLFLSNQQRGMNESFLYGAGEAAVRK